MPVQQAATSTTRLRLALVLAVASGCASYPIPTATVESFGIYRSFAERPHRRSELHLVEQTGSIPCELGGRFGVSYRIDGLPLDARWVPLSNEWEHPPMLVDGKPRSKTWVPWHARVSEGLGTSYTGFSGWHFDYPYELVAGTWKLSVVYHGRPLVTRVFEVHDCPPVRG